MTAGLLPRAELLAGVRGLVLDVDGTLVDDDTSDEALSSIGEMISRAGLRLLIATGRAFGSTVEALRPLLASVPEALLAVYNGTVVCDVQGNVLGRETIARDVASEVIRTALGAAGSVLGYGVERRRGASPRDQVWGWGDAERCHPEFNSLPVSWLEPSSRRNVSALLVPVYTKQATRLTSLLTGIVGISITRSTSRWIECRPAGITKAHALERARALLRESGAFVAVGDSQNDLEVLRAAEIGIAVANADGSVKAVAPYRTGGPSTAGVHEVVSAIVHARGGYSPPTVSCGGGAGDRRDRGAG